jgi:hypothetical protein
MVPEDTHAQFIVLKQGVARCSDSALMAHHVQGCMLSDSLSEDEQRRDRGQDRGGEDDRLGAQPCISLSQTVGRSAIMRRIP